MTTAERNSEDSAAAPAVGSPLDRQVRRRVTHQQVYRRGPFGGTMNTTLCGRVRDGNEMNCSANASDVTCMYCLTKRGAQA